jgi:hypothetical protein
LSIYSSAIGTIFNFQQRASTAIPLLDTVCYDGNLRFLITPCVAKFAIAFLPKPFCSNPKMACSAAGRTLCFGVSAQLIRQQRLIIGKQMRSESRTQCIMGIIYRFFLTHLISFTGALGDLCVSFVFVCVRLF